MGFCGRWDIPALRKMTISKELQEKAERILPSAYKEALARAAVDGTITEAYSGGVDSRFLAWSATLLGYRVHLLHVEGAHVAPEETEEALTRARKMGLSVELLSFDPAVLPALAAAGRNRCYACKTRIFTALLQHAQEGKICDGTNASDLGVYRPGLRALKELHVHSPLAEANISKPQLREFARELQMDDPEQAARPCLLTRLPYGALPTLEELHVLAQAETLIASDPALADVRFRLRLPAKDAPVLHIESASSLHVSDVALDSLCARLAKLFPSVLAHLTWKRLEKLSGFYDRQSA